MNTGTLLVGLYDGSSSGHCAASRVQKGVSKSSSQKPIQPISFETWAKRLACKIPGTLWSAKKRSVAKQPPS